MITSLYNPCLLITTIKGIFRLIGIQIDNTLFLGLNEFAILEESEL